MINETIIIRIDPEIKKKVSDIAKEEHHSMTGLILSLIDKKIEEIENEN